MERLAFLQKVSDCCFDHKILNQTRAKFSMNCLAFLFSCHKSYVAMPIAVSQHSLLAETELLSFFLIIACCQSSKEGNNAITIISLGGGLTQDRHEFT